MDGYTRLGGLASLAGLAAELGDLKRLRDAASPDSLASRAFRAAWGRLVAGEAAAAVAFSVTADCLAATRLGGIDWRVLEDAGVGDPLAVLQTSFDQVAGALEPRLRDRLRASLARAPAAGPAPDFAEALIRQPRAGATCPNRPRLVLEPPEGHGDHCLVVAVLGTVLAGVYDADPATVFVAGLAHHLHNAYLPDSGFAGEMLLGDALGPVMQRLFARAQANMPVDVAHRVRCAFGTIGDAGTAEGRAFNAADVIDRVLQMKHYDRVAAFTVDQALDDLQLVHAGPLQAFHHAVLRDAGLP